MSQAIISPFDRSVPSPSAVLELLKPVTWFAPMWAFMCGVVSSGVSLEGRWHLLVGGVFLAGPLLCATSQAVNDWYDRHVDAINQPERPIPSGRIPGTWGFRIAVIWSVLSIAFSLLLGPWVAGAAVGGLVLAWAYSAPPLRLKMSGWWGPAAVALCYEGFAWFTGAAVMTGELPSGQIILLAALYSVGTHGIMTLNDFKAVEGDRQMGVRSLPATIGVELAASVACIVMVVPQVVVVGALIAWGHPWFAAGIAASIVVQIGLMSWLVRNPVKNTPVYAASGVSLFVLGMLAAALAVGPFAGGT